MKTLLKLAVATVALVGLASLTGYAQDQVVTTAPPGASLGDVARQLRVQKAKTSKPAVVLTNDTLDAPKDDISATAAKKPSSDASSDLPKSDKHDAAYFREQQTKLQDRLDTDKRELDVLTQKLGQNNMQFYSNPQDSLTQQYTRGDIDKLTSQIDAKKQAIDDDQKAIDDLHELLRRENGDPGWLR
jgi:hypothetical protein